MGKKQKLLNNEIVLVNWDWADDKGPKCVEAVITIFYGNDKYGIFLDNPIILPDGSSHQKLVIEGRHNGYPITKIFPGFIRNLFIFNHPLTWLICPLVAVNISTEAGYFFSRSNIYLKSVYFKVVKNK